MNLKSFGRAIGHFIYPESRLRGDANLNFGLGDTNRDRKPSPDEARSAGTTDDEIRRFDTNGDGYLQRDEYVGGKVADYRR